MDVGGIDRQIIDRRVWCAVRVFSRSLREVRIRGQVVRVLRSYPGSWVVYALGAGAAPLLIGTFDKRPAYKARWESGCDFVRAVRAVRRTAAASGGVAACGSSERSSG